jgi:hypothetical protein
MVASGIGLSCKSEAERQSEDAISVKSSLEGMVILPRRVRWIATPSLPSTRVRAVQFLVGRRVAWIDREPPYEFGGDDAYLVTTWLRTDGPNRLTVRVIAKDGRRAAATVGVRAREPPPAPPGSIVGFLARPITSGDREASGLRPRPGGFWALDVYDNFLRIGWADADTGELRAHAYESRSKHRLLRIGVPIQMGPEGVGKISAGWNVGGYDCQPDGPSATYRWSVLDPDFVRLNDVVYYGVYELRAVRDPCDRRRAILEGTWYGAD